MNKNRKSPSDDNDNAVLDSFAVKWRAESSDCGAFKSK